MGLFTFVAPCEVTGGPVQGIDSYVGQYDSATFELGYDYGVHSSSLQEFEGEPGYLEWTTLIDNRSAKLVVSEVEWAKFPLVVCVHFPKVFETAGTWDMLTMCGSGATQTDRQVVADIYMTVDFPDP